ncbi:MAG: NAD-dependent protein deacylase, partial [Verrucomicrobiota bacterium]
EVVLFGEALPEGEVGKLGALINEPIDLVMSIGTSSLFPYIAEPVLMAKEHRIPTVEINVGKTDLSAKVDFLIQMDGADALAALWD